MHSYIVVDSIGLHRVENPSNVETAVSLHLYCPPYCKCYVFNENSGQRSVANVTFWSMYGERRQRVSKLRTVAIKYIIKSYLA